MADPNCRWCHGTGQIALAISVVPCDCVRAAPPATPPPAVAVAAVVPKYKAVDIYRGPAGTAVLLHGYQTAGPARGCIGEMFGVSLSSNWKPPRPAPTAADFGFPKVGAAHPHEPGLHLVKCERRGKPDKFFYLEWAYPATGKP